LELGQVAARPAGQGPPVLLNPGPSWLTSGRPVV